MNDPSREPIVICALLSDAKAELLPLVVPAWNALDTGGRPCAYVVGVTDASEATRQRFIDLVRPSGRTIHCTVCPNVESLLLPPGTDDPTPGLWSDVALHRVSLLREAVRLRALEVRFGERPAKWFLWFDDDIDPSRGAPAFRRLHEVMTTTRGPLRPRLVSGLYATRQAGRPISQWFSDDADDGGEGYLPVLADRVQASRCAGFGCMLAGRETMRDFGWGQYKLHLQWSRERVAAGHKLARLGEDVWLERYVEMATGAPVYVANDVLCDHYHRDGSCFGWERVTHDDGSVDTLRPVYRRTNQPTSAAVAVRNDTGRAWDYPWFGLDVPAGGVVLVSPELCGTLQSEFGSAAPVVERPEPAEAVVDAWHAAIARAEAAVSA